MSAFERPQAAGLINRVQNILLRPQAEWAVIETEPATTQGLLLGYAAPLALLAFACSLVGSILVGFAFGGLFGGIVRLIAVLIGGLIFGGLLYVLTVVMVFVTSIIINALAPSFEARSDSIQALKVAVYSATPFWLSGLLAWLPRLGGLLFLVGFGYGCYLLYLGVAQLLKPPGDKAVIFTAVIVGIEFGLGLVAGIILGIIFAIIAAFGLMATGAAIYGAY